MKEPVKWANIKADYITGLTYGELASKYDISDSSIKKRGAREKWTNEMQKMSTDITRRCIESGIVDRGKDAKTIDRISNKVLGLFDAADKTGEIKQLAETIDRLLRLKYQLANDHIEKQTVQVQADDIKIVELPGCLIKEKG